MRGQPYSKIGSHQYSASQTSNYAIGVGKTASANNLKATVSGGNFCLTGDDDKDKRKRIEYKCSPSGGISQIKTSSNSVGSEPKFNHFYQKFRQQNKTESKLSHKGLGLSNNLTKNKFPLPFTGIEYPFIDGGGITSCGRDGIYADNKAMIQNYNDFEK